MGRANYVETIQKADEGTNIARTLAGVAVNVYLRGTSTPAVIYSDPVTNVEIVDQIITGDDGMVNFWADAGSYDIAFSDTMAPQRIADSMIGWEAAPMAAGSIPGTVLTDGSVPSGKLVSLLLAQLAPEIERQLIPVGQVIDWWRPNDTFPLPAGFEICDGRTIAAANHDFGTGANITLPDLRNRRVVGAELSASAGDVGNYGGVTHAAKSNGAASSAVDGYTGAPGIGGAGGTNAPKNIQHDHGPGTYGTPDHLHGAGSISVNDHQHGGTTNGSSAGNGPAFTTAAGTGSTFNRNADHTHTFTTNWAGVIGTSGQTAGSDRSLALGGRSDSQLTSALDTRSQHVGLLKLMKVRQA